MPRDKQLDLHFPKAGLHTAEAYGRQPTRQGRRGEYVRTTASGINVLGYDPAAGRDRGGSRFGLTKLFATQLTGRTFVVQELAAFASKIGAVPAVQQSQSGRVVYLIAVSEGRVFVSTPDDTSPTEATNSTGETPALNFSGVLQSTSVNQKQYFADGTNYVVYSPIANELTLWAATSGSLPRDDEDNAARLVTTWRGRVVLSGLLRDPQNWFMSAVGDPLDFEYQPATVTKTDAVSGNNSPLGLIGDVVTALIPATDDVLYFGGDHTIYVMKGDPADGGQLDLVSDLTGIAFGRAWCKDPYGNIFFFGTRPGVWRLPLGGQPERISQAIEPLLADIDTGRTIVSMVWNDRQQGFHLYLTPDDAPAAATHYFWEARTNAWFQVVHADNNHNPLCAIAYDGNDPDDRVILTGCWDGYIRYIDHTATTDDATPIASSVLIGPLLSPVLDEMLLTELQGVLGDTSGDVTYEILAGDTAETAIASAAAVTGTLAAGRNATQPIRVAGHAIYVRLSSTNRWAMETIRIVLGDRGTVRRRRPGTPI